MFSGYFQITGSVFTIPVPYEHFVFRIYSMPVAVFPLLLPIISLQFPFPINRDGIAIFYFHSGIGFGFTITDDFLAFFLFRGTWPDRSKSQCIALSHPLLVTSQKL